MLRQGDPRLEGRPVNGGLDAAAQQLNEARIRGYMQSLQQYRDFHAAAEHTGAAQEQALVVSARRLPSCFAEAHVGGAGGARPLNALLTFEANAFLTVETTPCLAVEPTPCLTVRRRASTGGRWAFWTRCRGRTASAATCSRRCCVRGRPSERARLLPRARRRRLLWHDAARELFLSWWWPSQSPELCAPGDGPQET
eukprot:COSAG01_NODE_4699_length_4804_cov_17.017216_6_plen_197_part_00